MLYKEQVMKRKFPLISALFIFLVSSNLAFAKSSSYPQYELLTASTADSLLIVVKTNPRTGQAWYKSEKKWVATQDQSPVNSSKYEFSVIAYKNNGWGLVRLDTVNGKTWVLEGTNWTLVEE
jgi:hypothetical protein